MYKYLFVWHFLSNVNRLFMLCLVMLRHTFLTLSRFLLAATQCFQRHRQFTKPYAANIVTRIYDMKDSSTTEGLLPHRL